MVLDILERNKLQHIKYFVSLLVLFVAIKGYSNNRNEYLYALSEAKKQELFGNYKQAFNLYKQCLEVENESDAALYQMANVYASVGEFEEAILHVKRAIEINPEIVWYQLQLAQFYKLNDQIDGAINSLKRSIKRNGKDDIKLEYNLANLLIEKEKYRKAERILNNIEDEKGVSEKVGLSKAVLYSRWDKSDQSVREIHKLVDLYPEKPEFYGLLSEYYIDNQDFIKANAYLNFLLEIDPENKKGLFVRADYYKLQNNRTKYDSIIHRVFISENIDFNEKIEYFNRNLAELQYSEDSVFIEKCFSDLKFVHTGESLLYRFLADYYIRIHHPRKAKAELISLKQNDFKNPVIWHQLLYVSNVLKDSLLIDYANEALIYFPNEPIFIWFKGVGYYHEKDYKKAINTLTSVNIDKVPSKELQVQFYILLGEIYNDVENHEKTDEIFQKALELDPDNLLILNNYGYYLALRSERLDLAKEYSYKCIKQDPKNSTFLDTYAWVLYQMGEYRKAKKYILRAIKFGGGSNAEIVEHYGDILFKLNNIVGAKRQWNKAEMLGNKTINIDDKIK